MQRKHSNAPWGVSLYDHRTEAVIGRMDSICAMRKTGDYTQEQFEANVRIITTAPLMELALWISAVTNYRTTGATMMLQTTIDTLVLATGASQHEVDEQIAFMASGSTRGRSAWKGLSNRFTEALKDQKVLLDRAFDRQLDKVG